ncbi:MAG: hypothetical protein NT154_06985, partial [Verrucomicrobia bacterium]|nr:hypothetical protein [Verrucomicrobiota bacterium]
GDALLGRVTHSGPLAIGGSYTESVTASLPGLTPGGYHVIVRTDIMNDVRESDESNNIGVSAQVLTNDVMELTLGQPYTNVLATGDNHFYKVQVPAGETLAVSADSQTTNAWNELFTRFDAMPSRADYDYLYEQPFLPGVGVTVPETTNGWYYNLFRTEYSQTNQQNYQIEADLIPFSITSVYPTSIGDNGQVTLTIKGARFEEGMIARLVGSDSFQVEAQSVRLEDKASLKARFIMDAVPHGSYRLTVQKPNGESIIAGIALRVEESRSFAISCPMQGTTAPRVGSTASAMGQIVNTGNVDIPYAILTARLGGGIRAWLRHTDRAFPKPTDTSSGIDALLVRDLEVSERVDFTLYYSGFDTRPSPARIALYAHSKAVFLEKLKTQAEYVRSALLAATTTNTVLSRHVEILSSPDAWWRQMSEEYVRIGLLDRDCVENSTQKRETLAKDEEVQQPQNTCEVSQECTEFLIFWYVPIQIVLSGGAAEGNLPAIIAGYALRGFMDYRKAMICSTGPDTESCAIYNFQTNNMDWTYEVRVRPQLMGSEGEVVEKVVCVKGTRPTDPNEIRGPSGFGSTRLMPAGETMAFTIYFENVPTATAPAQTVRVRNQLLSTFDWRTFRLNEIVFGTNVITVPANRSYYQTRVNLGPDQNNLLADVIAGIDIRTGQAFCTLSAIDPATGEAPEDPQLGLLPPNTTNHVGEGHITYTITPKPGQPTGTLITNQAAITFDTYETILTGIWTNTLDAYAPTSMVVSLPAQMNQLTFDVSWFGWDETNGSGVGSYDVYVSDNSGDWTLWQSASTTNTAAFTGVPGHTYAFYSVARDNVGNLESKLAQAEAQTTVASGLNQPPVLNAMQDVTVTDGQEAVVPLSAYDADGTNQTLTFSFG